MCYLPAFTQPGVRQICWFSVLDADVNNFNSSPSLARIKIVKVIIPEKMRIVKPINNKINLLSRRFIINQLAQQFKSSNLKVSQWSINCHHVIYLEMKFMKDDDSLLLFEWGKCNFPINN